MRSPPCQQNFIDTEIVPGTRELNVVTVVEFDGVSAGDGGVRGGEVLGLGLDPQRIGMIRLTKASGIGPR